MPLVNGFAILLEKVTSNTCGLCKASYISFCIITAFLHHLVYFGVHYCNSGGVTVLNTYTVEIADIMYFNSRTMCMCGGSWYQYSSQLPLITHLTIGRNLSLEPLPCFQISAELHVFQTLLSEAASERLSVVIKQWLGYDYAFL